MLSSMTVLSYMHLNYDYEMAAMIDYASFLFFYFFL